MNEPRDPGSLRRQEVILDVVRGSAVRSQGELQQLLRKRGIAAAQPTLSRDLRELGLAKSPRGYLAPEAPVAPLSPAVLREDKLRRALSTKPSSRAWPAPSRATTPCSLPRRVTAPRAPWRGAWRHGSRSGAGG